MDELTYRMYARRYGMQRPHNTLRGCMSWASYNELTLMYRTGKRVTIEGILSPVYAKLYNDKRKSFHSFADESRYDIFGG